MSLGVVIRERTSLENISHRPSEGLRQMGNKREMCPLAKTDKLDLRKK
jgi:hypothetical protein